MKAVLDACVLFPTVLREILADVAGAGLFQPLWSERIISEWTHAARKLGDDQAARAGAEAALLRLRFPEAEVITADEQGLVVQLPDAGDLHVVRTAVDGGAATIVTMNLRDFPRRALEPLAMDAVHPDMFLSRIAALHPREVLGAVEDALACARAAGGDLDRQGLLRRARLPRLNKMLERSGAGPRES